MVEAPARAVPLETAREIVRLSELYLDGTVKGIIAADTKGMGFAAMLTTVSGALLGAAATLLFGESHTMRQWILGGAALLAGVVFFAALCCTGLAVRPRRTNVPGNSLANWSGESDLYGDLSASLMAQAHIYQVQIVFNIAKIEESTTWLQRALRLVLVCPLAGTVGGVCAYSVVTLAG